METIPMTTREKLIHTIAQAPEELIEELFDFLLFLQTRRQNNQFVRKRSLEEIIEGMQAQAQANGLTPEILDEILSDDTSLMQIMDHIGYKAEKNGLTPEILESILANED